MLVTFVKKSIQFVKKEYDLVVLMGIATWLRLVNLGYSDYQGDEIKALFRPAEGQSISDFLLSQRKGPLQFVVTFLMKYPTHDYLNRLLLRLPFALAGILAVLVFYRLVRLHFGRRISFFAGFFMAINGFFIAFSRIVQYQSFVIWLSLEALYQLSLAKNKPQESQKHIWKGLVAWALSILFHYDGVFITPFVAYLFIEWCINYNKTQKLNLKNILRFWGIPAVVSLGMLLSFYVPFALHLTASTKNYWKGRINDSGVKISSSRYLFSLYQPIYAVHIYMIIACLGIGYSALRLARGLKRRGLDVKPWLSDARTRLYLGVGLWLALPLTFMEGYVYVPGTHIYAYIIPGFIFIALGIAVIQDLLEITLSKIAFSQIIFWSGMGAIMLFLFAQANQVFVDHSKEYPWEVERFWIWTFPQPIPMYHLSLFGFPYYRHWDEIAQFVENNNETTEYYSTNEKKSIARYHIKLKKDTTKAGFYIYIKHPQSFENTVSKEKAYYWITNYPPVASFFKGSDPIASIYEMPSGSLDELKRAGY